MAATVEAGRIDLRAVHRFANGVVDRDGHLRWDVDRLFAEVDTGLSMVPDARSVGISTWGVDYGLLDDTGRLVEPPISYRDARTREVVDDVHQRIAPEDLYRITGLQFLPFNTLYQLFAERSGPRWERASHVVLLPDLLAHHLTGELGTEMTNASTTGLLDATTATWSTALLDALEIPEPMLGDLRPPGEIRGTTVAGTTVTTVASHDTASAVAAVPATTDRFAYIVSGTWSLVGVELPAPVLTDAARAANFTNELGLDGRTRFLRNVGGLWLLQECLRTWGRSDLDGLLAAASRIPPGGPVIDVDDPGFIAPGAMPARIGDAAGRELHEDETVRCILDSLALGYARTIERAASLSGLEVEVVHIVGGGSQNELLCQLTADATGRPVLAGPVEATAMGNIMVQARAHGCLLDSLADARAEIAREVALRRYEPR